MINKIRKSLEDFGAIAGTLYIIDQALIRISSHLRLFCYEFLIQPIPDKPLVPARFVKSLKIREIKYSDPELDLMPISSEIKELRFKQNAICLGAFQKGEFIGYFWFSFHTYEEDEVRCTYLLTPEDESAFDFDLYIFPEHRMGLAFIGVWNGACEYLRTKGVKYSYSRLTRFNLASRRAHQRLGSKCISRAVFLKLWQFEFMMATVFPYMHISILKPNRASIRMRPDVLLK